VSDEIYPFIPLQFETWSPEEQLRRSRDFVDCLSRRRTVRAFSQRPVAYELIENAVRAAASAPSGANQQPWRFVVVTDPEIRRRLRQAAESEERDNYNRRFPDEWLQALRPLGTDWHKPFLTDAPYLIVVFRENWGEEPAPQQAAVQRDDTSGTEEPTPPTGAAVHRIKHYYVMESVGIAVGMLLAALHWCGLATLTHTPSPMGFLNEVLGRPANEKAYVVIPVGYPADDARVPDIHRKPLEDVLLRID
jgi:nitroreductase